MAASNGYFANNGALVTLTLPASASIGDTFKVVAKGAGLVKIAQNASDQIIFGSSSTTSGATGYIQANAQGNAVEIVAYDTNTFYVLNSVGNWTIN